MNNFIFWYHPTTLVFSLRLTCTSNNFFIFVDVPASDYLYSYVICMFCNFFSRDCCCVRLFSMGCFYLWLCSSFWANVYSYIYSYVICMFCNFFFKLFQPKEMLNLCGFLVLLFDFVGAHFYLIGGSSPPGVSLNSLRLILLSFDSTTSLDSYKFLFVWSFYHFIQQLLLIHINFCPF